MHTTPRHPRRPIARSPEERMLDLAFVAAIVAFFAVSLAYVRGCGRL
jgi:hypothetical protein